MTYNILIIISVILFIISQIFLIELIIKKLKTKKGKVLKLSFSILFFILQNILGLTTILNIKDIYDYLFIKSSYSVRGITVFLLTVILFASGLAAIINKLLRLLNYRENNSKNKISRRDFFKYAGLTGMTILPIIPINYSKYCDENLIIRKAIVKSDKIPLNMNNFRIIHITDIHVSHHVRKEYLLNIVNKINKMKKDLVVMTGDYLTYYKDRYYYEFINIFKNLKEKDKIFAVLGNHDIWCSESKMITAFRKMQIRLLLNENLRINKNNSIINLSGINSLKENKANFDKALKNLNHEHFNILLAHTPNAFEHIKNKNIDLVISGHTHGGQIRMPFIGAPIIPSDVNYKYQLGLYKENNKYLYISAGLGTVGLPMRFLCNPDISMITLKSI